MGVARPKCLDLFCGAGGAAMGLYRAGFDIVGIDNRRQPRYPFPFIQADALRPPVRLEDFDLVWASPPCQGYSIMRNLPWLKDRHYPMLIEQVRAALLASGVIYVVENVPGAPLKSPARLCGISFGLKVYRHRLFESNFTILTPPHQHHEQVICGGRNLKSRARRNTWNRSGNRINMDNGFCSVTGDIGTSAVVREAMGIDWMRGDDISQAIPPAYSEHIGYYAMMALGLDPDAMKRDGPTMAAHGTKRGRGEI